MNTEKNVPISGFENSQPLIAENVFIHDSAVVIGKVTLGADVSVWPCTVIRGDVEQITIGAGTNIQDGAVLHVSHASPFSPVGQPLCVGEHVTIGHRAVLHACRVGSFCLIGIGAIVLDGAELEDFIILGAGALVPPGKKLKGGYLYVGTPAKEARALTESEFDFLRYSAKHYIALKDQYLAQA